MASRLLSRLTHASHLSAASVRSYATARATSTGGVTLSQRRTTATKKAPVKTPAAEASTTVGRGNPQIVETLPTTADEIDIPPEAFGVPSESVPSSSTLREPSAPSAPPPSSPPFPVEFTESNVIGGSPKDPLHPDWSRSYFGLSTQPFPKEVAEVLMTPVDPMDVEIKPDGLIYLPEIKYRRVLNKAFGPGGWGLAPRSETNVGPRVVSREYALVCLGRLVAIARGEQEYFDPNGIPTATEACKSNALMRCCKDLGIASELWDPRFIREFKAKHAIEVFVEDQRTKKKKKLWRRKDQPPFEYPFKET
ncbi:Mgm101p-domain-containing protein [Trametes coccinea BRFM310]|uniref:Mitochondrial genome maintenance protein MGM101 n=1 Tax=Trametes coccinea (strain BRFM310) TaxID=1353009 RepID=A0A1Y2ITT8_TRAC3|nr:Mgm101p-domain-containing protein [Trametes coccinea BRFM310]